MDIPKFEAPKGFHTVPWEKLEEGDTVYIVGTNLKQPCLYGPHTVKDPFKRELMNGMGDVFLHYPNDLVKENPNFPVMEEMHVQGIISIENMPEKRIIKGDLGIQIAEDGRVWICVDGIALLRFRTQDYEKGGKQ